LHADSSLTEHTVFNTDMSAVTLSNQFALTRMRTHRQVRVRPASKTRPESTLDQVKIPHDTHDA